MIKNRSIIEAEVNGRVFRLECYGESPLSDVLQAVNIYKNYLENRLKESQESAKSEESKDEKECPTPTCPKE